MNELPYGQAKAEARRMGVVLPMPVEWPRWVAVHASGMVVVGVPERMPALPELPATIPEWYVRIPGSWEGRSWWRRWLGIGPTKRAVV